MSTGGGGQQASSDKTEFTSPEKIVEKFQKLREEQQMIASKIAQVDGDRSEHKLVAETLEGVDPARKCFRLIGGVLVERTVGEVLPALRENEKKLLALMESLNASLVQKGKELNEFREKHNIRFVTEGANDTKTPSARKDEKAAGVLVSN